MCCCMAAAARPSSLGRSNDHGPVARILALDNGPGIADVTQAIGATDIPLRARWAPAWAR